MGPTVISFLLFLVFSCLAAFIIDRLLRPSLRAMLDALVELPAATTFYVRAFSTTVFLVVLSRVFGGKYDLKPGARFMEYVWEAGANLQESAEPLRHSADIRWNHRGPGRFSEAQTLSNDHYLIVSYFAGFGLSLGLAWLTYRIFRGPFGRIADAALKDSKSVVLKRALPVLLTVGAAVSFLGVSYTNDSCRTYEYKDVVKERAYLHKKNRQQMAETSLRMAQVIVMFSVAAAICVIVIKRNEKSE